MHTIPRSSLDRDRYFLETWNNKRSCGLRADSVALPRASGQGEQRSTKGQFKVDLVHIIISTLNPALPEQTRPLRCTMRLAFLTRGGGRAQVNLAWRMLGRRRRQKEEGGVTHSALDVVVQIVQRICECPLHLLRPVVHWQQWQERPNKHSVQCPMLV